MTFHKWSSGMDMCVCVSVCITWPQRTLLYSTPNRCINYLLTDKAYRCISSWTHPQRDPRGLWSWCAGLKHEDSWSDTALCGLGFSSATPGLHRGSCPDRWPGPGYVFHPSHPSVISRSSLHSCTGPHSASWRSRVPAHPQWALPPCQWGTCLPSSPPHECIFTLLPSL